MEVKQDHIWCVEAGIDWVGVLVFVDFNQPSLRRVIKAPEKGSFLGGLEKGLKNGQNARVMCG